MMQLMPSSNGAVDRKIGAFLRWWRGELVGVLPKPLRKWAHGAREQLILELGAEEVVLRHRVGDTVTPLGYWPLALLKGEQRNALTQQLQAFRGDAAEIILRLPAERALHKRLELPLAVEENLRQVLTYEMDRQTPFKADQVYFDYEILARHAETRRMQVALTLVPRPQVDDALQRLAALSIKPQRVDVMDAAAGTPANVNLLPPEQRVAQSHRGAIIKGALAGLIVLLLFAAVFIPLWRERSVLRELQPVVARAQAEAQEVQALREQLDQVIAQSRYLIDQKTRSPVAIEVVNELTKLLPDDTWLSSLELKSRQVRIQGESSAASALIGLIEASPMFFQTSFSSPVTQNPTTGHERFQLSTTVEAAPANDAQP